MRRNFPLVLAVVFTLGGSRLVFSDDLHGTAPVPASNQSAATSDNAAAPESSNRNSENYRGFLLDLMEITQREDYPTIVKALHRQIDIVEGVGLSQRVLEAFHSVPIVVDEFGCIGNESLRKPPTTTPVVAGACYGARVPGNLANDEDISNGVIMRPITLANYSEQRPIVLHELLHFYHAHIFPLGVEDPAIEFHYKVAGTIYQNGDAYVLRNEREFFAVTASIFLYGNDDQHEPFTRAQLKEKQPDYYKYLVSLFGFDPAKGSLASAN